MRSHPNASSLLQAVTELAMITGAAAHQHYRQDIVVERKGDGSPVTRADREAEQLARAWLARRFPNDAIVGEEFGSAGGSSGRTWLLDPVDGTKTFVRGVPLWGSLVALVEGDVVLAGAASFPAVAELLCAARGEGCWHNGSRCQVSAVASLSEATALTSDEYWFADAAQQHAWKRIADAAGIVRTWGDCYGYLLVATGRAEIMMDARLNPWDITCFVPIIEEAGGRITDFAGGSYPPLENAIATNAALAEEARRFV
jgi:histidinol phosphatase-like enzyme (inositol monophosphatase family)